MPGESAATTDAAARAAWWRVLARFSRPHTIVATSFQVGGIFALVAFAAGSAPWDVLLLTWLASLAANLYVVGLNQLTDVAIDRLNKPELPLASGDLSRPAGWGAVLGAGLLALLIGAARGPFLLLTVAAVMAIGTVYSLPPARLKGHPVLAAASIALARGVLANLGLYLHYTWALGRTAWPPAPLFTGALLFFFGFGLVIALFKDIPDRDGDRHFAVETFAVRLGRRRVLGLARWLLTGLYVAPVAAALALLPGAAGVALAAAHLALLALFWAVSRRTDPSDPASVTRLYMLLWGLFYAEFALLAAWSLAAVRLGAPGFV